MLFIHLIGFLSISILGTLLHFVYDWSKHCKYLRFFVPVNESTWEHLKLALLPTIIWSAVIINFGIGNNILLGTFVANLSIIVLIPAIFYSYTSFTKKPILWVDISSFFVTIFLSMLFSYLITSASYFGIAFDIIGIVGNVLIIIAFCTFSYFPPRCFLFKDPISGGYGFKGHYDDKTINK